LNAPAQLRIGWNIRRGWCRGSPLGLLMNFTDGFPLWCRRDIRWCEVYRRRFTSWRAAGNVKLLSQRNLCAGESTTMGPSRLLHTHADRASERMHAHPGPLQLQRDRASIPHIMLSCSTPSCPEQSPPTGCWAELDARLRQDRLVSLLSSLATALIRLNAGTWRRCACRLVLCHASGFDDLKRGWEVAQPSCALC
jgi:hypothetical protein